MRGGDEKAARGKKLVINAEVRTGNVGFIPTTLR